MNEMWELISHYHDAEFEYNGTTYVLQPEVKDDKTYLVIKIKQKDPNKDDVPDTAAVLAAAPAKRFAN